MADENVTTNIVVNSNFSSLIGDLNKASAALMNFKDKLSVSNKALAQQVAVINRTFAETMRSTGQFSTHFVSLNSDVEKFGSQLDKGQIKLNQFFRTFHDHTKTSGGLIRQLAQQQVQLQNAILQPLGRNAEGLMQYNVHIPRGLDTVKNKTALAKQELQIMNKVIQQGSNQLINWGKNTQWAGRQLTVGLTVPLAAFGKAAADAFNKADQELTRLTKVYGGVAQTSATELKKIRNEVAATAADLAKTYGASFQDTIALAADIAATGKQGNDLLNSVRETTRLSVLGEVDRQDAMKATLAIQTAFKQNTKELGESINFLNAVENQTSTTLQDLVEAIPKAGPVIKGLGGNVKDLALYLTAMKEGGISATEGANALKSGLASLINPTKVAKDTFMGFGINLESIVNKNAGNTTGTILELQAALDKLDPLKKQKALEQLFGKFQFARMNALFSNLGKQGSQTLQVLDLMKASSQDLANIAGRELSQVTQSASGKYRRALEGLKADLAGVGNQFLTINTALINIVDKVVEFANHLPKPIKQLLSVLGMFTAAAGPLIMLTGVLGNFVGYVVKGIFHLRSLFKGGEGWKFLTPEILAANKAASLAEQTFYSDAKAATVFNQAVQGLTGSLAVLESKLNAGILNIAPQMTNMAMGLREVNPQHPLLSAVDTRSMSHMNPVAAMTAEEKQAQTLFGVLPGAPKVNQRIGATPQMYMTNDLPNVAGVSQMRGVSTGVVAAEAAKWHSMTAALAMQSKTELAKLKTEIATTGLVTEELSTAYQAVLPKMNELVSSAAAEAAQIVESARVGKISADQARAEITALNARIEQMMVQTATSTAAGLGRTIDVTKVPLLDQPIVDAAGKSNLKELTKPGRTRDLLNKIAGVLGVKTYGAGYSMETTRPKRFATGDIVPGTGNQDTVPAMLTPGEFVVKKSAVNSKTLPILHAINQGKGGNGPGFDVGGTAKSWEDVKVIQSRMIGSPNWEQEVRSRTIMHDAAVLMDRGLSKDQAVKFATKDFDIAVAYSKNKYGFIDKTKWLESRKHIFQQRAKYMSKLNATQVRSGVEKPVRLLTTSMQARPSGVAALPNQELLQHVLDNPNAFGGSDVVNNIFSSLYPEGIGNVDRSGRVLTSTRIVSEHTSPFARWGYKAVGNYGQAMLGEEAINSRTNALNRRSKGFIPDEIIMTNAGLASYEKAFAKRFGISPAQLARRAKLGGRSQVPGLFAQILSGVIDSRGGFRHAIAANSGGLIPGYMNGNIVKPLSKAVIARLTSGWGKSLAHGVYNDNPLHGPLHIGTNANLVRNQSPFHDAATLESFKYGLPRKINYGNMEFGQQFPIGSEKEQALYALNQYMQGYNASFMSLPAVKRGLAGMSSIYSGKAYRGFMLNSKKSKEGIPNHIAAAIYDAQMSGDFSSLIGKKFMMRSASWSENPAVAGKFADIGKYHPADLMGTTFEVQLDKRKVINASNIFPNIGFDASGKWPGQNKESELLFGGAFQIIHAEPGKIVLSTSAGNIKKREHGGDVNTGKPYMVGEKGPELFVPGKSGTIIPHYARGGMVGSFLAQTALSGLGYFGGSALGGMLGGNAGSMIGGLLGGSIGGFGSLRHPRGENSAEAAFDKVHAAYNKSAIPVTKWKDALAETALSGSRLNSTLSKMALGISRTNVLFAAGTTAAILAYKAWDKAAKARTASQDAIKINKNDAQQLGITYKSVIGDIKSTTAAIFEQRKLLAAKAAGAAGVGGGVNMTVKQLKELQKEVKSTSPDLIKMFDNMAREDVVKNAADLKAQMIAGGMAADKAANKIYALMSLSNKAGMTADAFGSSDFSWISDKRTAARYGAKTTANAFTNKTDKKELVATFDQGLVSVNAYYDSISKVKDKTGKLVYDNKAVAKTVKEIQSAEGGRVKLGQKNLEILLQQKPELRNILSASDSLADAWVKTKLYTSGVAGDLSKLSGADAQGILKVAEALKSRATSLTTTDTSGPFAGLIKASNLAKAAAKSTQAAADAAGKNAQITADQQTKAIDKVIQKLNDEYDARRKLIEYQADKTSYNISLQKEQLDYQNKMASGDMEGAAQAQLNLKQLNVQYQKQQALAALEEKHAADLKKEDARKQKVQDNLNAAQAKAAKLAEAAAAAQQKASSIAIIQQSISNTLVAASMTKDAKELDKLGKSFQSDVNALAKIAPEAAKTLTPENKTSTWGTIGGKRVPVAAGQDWTGYLSSMTQGKGTVMFDKTTQESLKGFGLTLDSFTEFWGKLLNLPEVSSAAKKRIAQYHNKGFAGGGLISGPGTGTSDSIYMPMMPNGKFAGGAYLSNGEFVVKSSAVKKPGALNFLNKLNYDPSYAVPNNMWGVSGNPMSGMGNITIAPVIHAAPGMDEHMIADLASRKAFAMLKDAGYMQNRSIGSSKVVGR
jgi:TP901 family phage tail tape measure protein